MKQNNFCNKCDKPGIWFKTKEHYLDLKDGQFKEFLRELAKCGLSAENTGYKTITVTDPKSETKIIIEIHECGPLIEFGKLFLMTLACQLLVDLTIKTFKKLLKKVAKNKKEKPFYEIVNNISDLPPWDKRAVKGARVIRRKNKITK